MIQRPLQLSAPNSEAYVGTAWVGTATKWRRRFNAERVTSALTFQTGMLRHFETKATKNPVTSLRLGLILSQAVFVKVGL